MSSEHELIDVLARLFASPASRRVATVGIGDDAAVLASPAPGLVWTVDVAVEGTHFDLALSSPEVVGERSFNAAVSDLAAMGARPVAALSSIAAPAAHAAKVLARVAKGQALAAKALACPIVGGNLARASELSVTTTVLGVAKRPLTRSGASAGDDVWLLGDVGLAHVGLVALQRKARGSVKRSRDFAACIDAFEHPRARLTDGQRLVGRATALIDVSDGLAADAGHIAKGSHVRLVVEETALRAALRPELVRAATALGIDPLTAATSGGEDYALLATGPGAKKPRDARRIGRVVRGSGVFLEMTSGELTKLAGGFDHYARR